LGIRFGALVSATNCQTGVCLLLFPEEGEQQADDGCTVLCVATNDCPSGSSCMAVPVDESTGVSITATLACVPD
jgi:hypothetical protein